MPRLDTYHHTVKRALEKDHWTITHDPFLLQIGKKRLFADLGAMNLVSAEKDQNKIAIEIKSFLGILHTVIICAFEKTCQVFKTWQVLNRKTRVYGGAKYKSDVRDLEQAVGQYVVYRQLIDRDEPERKLYLAVTTKVYDSVFTAELGQLLITNQVICLVVFDAEKEVITQWIPN